MDLELNAKRFTGSKYVNIYDQYRPTPPIEIIHQTLNYLGEETALKVVDLGCGTGISTLLWKDFAVEVIGVEPSKEMLFRAKTKAKGVQNVHFVEAFSNNIPLESNTVDIVTCSQSFHWMEPDTTLHEINRILKEDGVLVIYDVGWPPSTNYIYERAYMDLFANVERITLQLDTSIAHKWSKEKHLRNVKESGYFTLVKEAYYHKTAPFSRSRFEGIAMSQGGLEALLKLGYSHEEIGIARFKDELDILFENPYDEMTYNYKVIFAVK